MTLIGAAAAPDARMRRNWPIALSMLVPQYDSREPDEHGGLLASPRIPAHVTVASGLRRLRQCRIEVMLGALSVHLLMR